MEKKAKVPKLRFPGFTEEWEQHKLGMEFKRANERNDGSFDRNNWISVAHMFFQNPKKVQSNNIDTRTYVMREGDIAFEGHPNSNFKFGRFVANDIGDGIISELFPIYRHRLNYDNKYWKYAIQLDNIMAPIFSKAITSSGNSSNKLDNKHFLRQSIRVPILEEQQKIGFLFTIIDNLITLHQRKLTHLQAKKKSLLQKMFPKKGERFPELRFPGFADAWQQRKFEELCDMVTVGIANSATHAYSNSGVVMFRNQNIKPNYLDDKDIIYINPNFETKYKNKRLKKNDLLVARTGYPGTACVVPEKYENAQTFTTLIARPKSKVNPFYLCQYLNSDSGIKYFESTQIGGGQKNSGAGILKQMPVFLPTSINEASKIADCFGNLDNLIILHQRKLVHLQTQKKALLQQMFV